MIIWVFIGIAIISVLLAYYSLRQLQSKKEIEEVKEELHKGKVIYHSDSSSSMSS